MNTHTIVKEVSLAMEEENKRDPTLLAAFTFHCIRATGALLLL